MFIEKKGWPKHICDTPAGCVGVLISAKKSDDKQLEALARAELIQRWDVFVRFGKDFGRDFKEEAERQEQQNVLYSQRDVQEMLRISDTQVQKLTKSGELGCIRISRACIRYSKQQIDKFIKSKTLEASKDSQE